MGSKQCANGFCYICEFCERKISPAICMSLILSRGCVLFLTDLHRRPEHTKARKMMAPPPTPPPKGRGVITEIPL